MKKKTTGIIEEKRFGLPVNRTREKFKSNKITRKIVIVLIFFLILSIAFSVVFMLKMRDTIANIALNNSNDATWISSLGSYWGGIIGGVFSGAFAFLGVFFTIKYYKESDSQKDRISRQPFLLVIPGSNSHPAKGFSLGKKTSEDSKKTEVNITIKNIGNGFANILVLKTGFNIGGHAFNKVISVGESTPLFFMVDEDELKTGVSFGIQYIDAMRNEYIQDYFITNEQGKIEIECGYPAYLE